MMKRNTFRCTSRLGLVVGLFVIAITAVYNFSFGIDSIHANYLNGIQEKSTIVRELNSNETLRAPNATTSKTTNATTMDLQGKTTRAVPAIEKESDAEDAPSPNSTSAQERSYQHNFTYDPEEWKSPPRIVITAGPHKTASTTLQTFFAKISDDKRYKTRKNPHPLVTNWVFPVGHGHPVKCYAGLAISITKREGKVQKKSRKTERVFRKFQDEYRTLFWGAWNKGKSIVFGSEEFDGFVQGFSSNNSFPSDSGKKTHVSKGSSKMVDSLLSLLPWENVSTTVTSNATAASSMPPQKIAVVVPPLRLGDIEIQINYRTPRVKHMVSIWHEMGGFSTFRNYLIHPNELYQMNSLALALQFVKKNLRVTLVDMTGVSQYYASDDEPTTAVRGNQTEAVVGGLQGAIAFKILRMDHLCDSRGRIHLPGYSIPLELNVKEDKNSMNLLPDQIDAIERVVGKYECGVWQHLRRYQRRGLLRVLFPANNLLGHCRPGLEYQDVSFWDTMLAVAEIAGQDNGIPFQTPEEQAVIQKEAAAKQKAQNKELSRIRHERQQEHREQQQERQAPSHQQGP